MAATISREVSTVGNAGVGDSASTGRRAFVSHVLVGRSQIIGIPLLLTGIALAYSVRLGSVIVSDMDEGTYLYAGKLVTQGLIPYRDFLLAHPPLVVGLAAGWQLVAGSDVMSARFAYMAFVLLSTLPLYLLASRVARSALAGVLAIALYTTGMLLLANMGRTIRLEPVMNAFLIAGSAAYLLRPRDRPILVLAGALFACAVLVKLVAVVPIALLFGAELVFAERNRSLVERWLAVAAGSALVLVPVAVWLFAQPNFVDDVIRSQLDRPGLPLSVRGYYLWQDFTRYPIIPLALAAAAGLIVWSRDPRARILSVVALGSTLALVALFKTFFGYYLVQVLPWLAIVFALTCVVLAQRATRHWRPAILAMVASIGIVLPAGYAEYYYRTATDHVSSPDRIVAMLRQGSGYIYTMYPSFALWSNRPIYPWYFQADALVPRLNGRLNDAGFIEAFEGSQALVLYADELADYPQAQAYVENHFHQAYADGFYALWVR